MHSPAQTVSRRRQGQRDGFTLIELVVVIMILGVLSSVTLPSLQGVSPKYRLRAAARSVSSQIHLVHSLASTIGKQYALHYNLEDRYLWIVLPPGEEDDPDLALEDREHLGRVLMPDHVQIERVILPDGSYEDSSQIDVIVDTKTSEGSHIVYLRNEDESLICVKFNALLGIVDYSSEEEEFAEY